MQDNRDRYVQSIVDANFTGFAMRDPMDEAFRFRHTFIRGFLTGDFQFDRFVVGVLDEAGFVRIRAFRTSTHSNDVLNGENVIRMA